MILLQMLTPENAQAPAIATVIGNVIFFVWTFAYNEIFSISIFHISWYAHIAMYIFPVLFCTLGYFAGYKKWELTGKFDFLVYENKKK